MSYKDTILQQTSEAAIYGHYVPTFKGKKGTYTSPFKPDEETPGFSIYQNGAGWKWTNYSAGDERHGDIWELVAQLKGIDCKKDFPEVCKAIAADMRLNLTEPKAAPAKIFEATTMDAFTPDFIAYWARWNVTPEVLSRYGVKQAASLRNGASESKGYKGWDYRHKAAALFTGGSTTAQKIIVPADPATGQKTKQVYNSPDSTAAYIFGIEQAEASKPETLIICEGEKDALVLAANGFNAVCFASATTAPRAAQIERIKTTGSKVFICYDTDEAGRKGAAKVQQLTGFPVVQLPAMEEGKNDLADYFSEGHSAADFSALLEAATIDQSAGNKAGEKEKGTAAIDINNYPTGRQTTPAEDVRALYVVKEQNGQIRDITIVHTKFMERLRSFGFVRYDLPDGTPVVVQVKDNVLKQVNNTFVQDTFFKWLDAAPNMINGVPLDTVRNKFYRGRESFFSTGSLTLLGTRPFKFCTDTREATFFFFQNGFVQCTRDTYELKPYSQLQGYIWKEQILEREVLPDATATSAAPESAGIFAQFIYNICGRKKGRFDQFTTIIGYLLHTYFEGPRKAIVLTDSSLSAGDNGRTGKTLFLKALENLKPARLLAGKSFDTADRFRYQSVNMQDQIVCINDVRKGFPLEPLFNDITEGLQVEQKNKNPFHIDAKMVIATNAPLKVEGASARDRVLEFEFGDHYSDRHHVADDFPGKWFFAKDTASFSAQDWNQFYNFAFYCCSCFHLVGMQEPEQENLPRRKLLQETCEAFVSWMDEAIEQGKIKSGIWYDKKDLHFNFLEEYQELRENKYWSKQNRFSEALIKFKTYTKGHRPHDKTQHERKNNAKREMIFYF